ncbi:translation protein, partial [Phellopilus nigrolimitatus]
YSSDKKDRPPCKRPGCGRCMKLLQHVCIADTYNRRNTPIRTLRTRWRRKKSRLSRSTRQSSRPCRPRLLPSGCCLKLQNIIILQNKVDLIKEAQALGHQKSITAFVKGAFALDELRAPPISAQLNYNIDAVIEYIMKWIPIPVWDFMSSPRLIVIRSFDVNKSGTEVNERMGSVTRGSILAGVLALEMCIEICLGIVTKVQQGCKRCRPIFSRIITLLVENNQLQFVVPSGLVGVGMLIDPMLCRADRLVGQVLGSVSKLSQIYTELEISLFLLQRLLDVKTEDKKTMKVTKLVKNELLLINIGSMSTGGCVLSMKVN